MLNRFGSWLIDLASRLRAAGKPEPVALDPTPADGRVGRIAVQGAIGDPNARDPQFVRFRSIEPAEPSVPPRGRPSRANPPLLGRIALLSLFVGRDGRGWSDPEIAEAHQALDRAGAWIEREAIRWGAAVNIDLAETYFAADDLLEEESVALELEPDADGPAEVEMMPRAIASASRAAARLGFADVAELIAAIDGRVAADRRVWLLHLRRAGRSIAIPADLTPLPGVCMAVCFAREADYSGPIAGPVFADPVTMVHELLHLFGASDKYDRPLSQFPRDLVSERDVMALNFEALGRLRIDPLTAREIGWPAHENRPPKPESGPRRAGDKC